jgi:hypothetical protein
MQLFSIRTWQNHGLRGRHRRDRSAKLPADLSWPAFAAAATWTRRQDDARLARVVTTNRRRAALGAKPASARHPERRRRSKMQPLTIDGHPRPS